MDQSTGARASTFHRAASLLLVNISLNRCVPHFLNSSFSRGRTLLALLVFRIMLKDFRIEFCCSLCSSCKVQFFIGKLECWKVENKSKFVKIIDCYHSKTTSYLSPLLKLISTQRLYLLEWFASHLSFEKVFEAKESLLQSIYHLHNAKITLLIFWTHWLSTFNPFWQYLL